jgi:GAF domain-containing protein
VASRSIDEQRPNPTGGAPEIAAPDTARPLLAPDGDLAVLSRLVEGTVRSTGAQFFHNLVRNLSLALDATHAIVAEFADSQARVRSLAFWGNGALLPDIEYDLAGTPCEDVARGQLCHYPSGVQQRCPKDHALVDMGVESCIGVPLLDGTNEILGHLAVFDVAPSRDDMRRLAILQIFAARAAAELERLRAEQLLRASERRFRDLYEEAPIAYVYEDTETRFVSANRAAISLLGLSPKRWWARSGASCWRRPSSRTSASTTHFATSSRARRTDRSSSSSGARTTAARSGCSFGRSPIRTASSLGR